ncbi:MAG: tryptophan 7-halogenase [Candidatus Rokubacteria bacterium]|nr:tryptophan 7-halogenase [Candidatus Rokubacteria bacterium]
MTAAERWDVVVVGGGPGGASAATFLARAGRRVLLFEREPFPRFHVGESLLPATLPILERLGVRATLAERGFQVKYGATFHDQESGLERTFYFLAGKPWPSYSYQVPRAEFDALLLEHAKKQGVDVRQPAAVEAFAVDADGVTPGASARASACRTWARSRWSRTSRAPGAPRAGTRATSASTSSRTAGSGGSRSPVTSRASAASCTRGPSGRFPARPRRSTPR